MKRILGAILVVLGAASLWAQRAADTESPREPVAVDTSAAPVAVEPADAAASATLPPSKPPMVSRKVYIVPIRGEIGDTTVFIVRRGVKDAIAADADTVMLDMETPGGLVPSTLEILDILDRFEGKVVTYVNRDAASAGAIIASVTDEIYFAPKGVMGAAEVVGAGGQDIGESMKRKMTSYMNAKIDAYASGGGYRADVIRAMMDPNFELKIGEEIIKKKDELLSVSAEKAMRLFGDPPIPLLGAGIFDSRDDLLTSLGGGTMPEVREFEATWSVTLAKWLTSSAVSSLLLSIGGLLIFIEFKTPGFGVIGISGIVLVVIVLFGHYVAGLSGHEAMIVFVVGFGLVMLELLFFQGTVVLGVLGLILMFGSLLWGMADVWPTKGFDIDPGMFVRPLTNLSLAALLLLVFALLVMRFLPRSVLFDRLVQMAEIKGVATGHAASSHEPSSGAPNVGEIGVVARDLHPSGVIDVAGRHYEARVELGELAAGTRVRIVRRADFVYIVEAIES